MKSVLELVIIIICFSLNSFSQKNVDSSGWIQNGILLENKLKVAPINWIEYSKNGDTIFTFGKDNYFRKWNNQTGKLVFAKDLTKFLGFNMQDSPKITSIDYCEEKNYIGLGTQTIFIKDYGGFGYATNILVLMNNDTSKIISASEIEVYWPVYNKPFITSNYAWNSIIPNKNIILNSVGHDYRNNYYEFIINANLYTNNISNLTRINTQEDFIVSKNIYSRINNVSIHEGFTGFVNHSNEGGISSGGFRLLKFNSQVNSNSFNRNYKNYIIYPAGNQWFAGYCNDSVYIYDYNINKIVRNYKINNNPDSNYFDFEVNYNNSIFTTISSNNKAKHLSLINSLNGEFLKNYIIPDSIYKVRPSYTRNEVVLSSSDSILRKLDFSDVKCTFNSNFEVNKLITYTNDTIQFINSTLSTGFNWKWDFGDGKTSNEYEPKYSYKTTGLFNVSLKISDSSNFSDAKYKNNYIQIIDRPTAKFVKDKDSGYAPLTVKFTSHADGYKINKILWYYLDGTNASNSPSVTFSKPGKYYISLVIKDGLGTEVTYTDSIVALKPTSVDSKIENQNFFDIYPNPSDSYINIKLVHDLLLEKVEIFNYLGQIVYSDNKLEDKINISELESGIYLLRINENNQYFSKTFIIER